MPEKAGRGPGRRNNPLVLNWIPEPEWMVTAACADDAEPEVFFRKNPIEAKATCAWCRVRETCLRFALENGITDGVWGGLSEDERREMKTTPTRPRPGFTKGKAPAA